MSEEINYKELYEDLLKDYKENVIVQSMNDMRDSQHFLKMQIDKAIEMRVEITKKIFTLENIFDYIKYDYSNDIDDCVMIDKPIYRLIKSLIQDISDASHICANHRDI